MLSVAAGIMILVSVMEEFSPLITTLNELGDGSGVQQGAAVLLKTVGICALAGFTADACRDSGNTSLASRVELAARTAIVIAALPLIKTILETAGSLLYLKG